MTSSTQPEDGDLEAMQRYTRIDSDPWGIRIQACVVTWPTPGRPESRWVTVGLLAPDAGDAAVERTRRRFLKDPKLFRRCSVCGRPVPVGLADSTGTCTECARRSRPGGGTGVN